MTLRRGGVASGCDRVKQLHHHGVISRHIRVIFPDLCREDRACDGVACLCLRGSDVDSNLMELP